MNSRRHPYAPGIDHFAIAACWPSKVVTDLGPGFRSDRLAATCAQVGIQFLSEESSDHWNVVLTTASGGTGASPSGTCAGADVGRLPKTEYPPD